MPYHFFPPTADTLSPVAYLPNGQPHPGNRLFRHFKMRASGQTVIKTGGVYRTKEYPLQDELDAADVFYLGGHHYVVDDTEAAALIAAGFAVGARAGFGSMAFGTGPFGT